MVSVGGYHDITEVVRFFTTGAYRIDDRWRYAEPNAYGKWVFVKKQRGASGGPGRPGAF